MWGKVIGKVMDICLMSGLVSLTAVCVVKAVATIRDEITGGKKNAGNPE